MTAQKAICEDALKINLLLKKNNLRMYNLPFKAAGTDFGVVKIYSWERGPSPASLQAWIQNL